MGELAGTIAHEIRTPLSALQGAVEIVCAPQSETSTREHFGQMIFKEVTRLNQVVQDFLNIGRQTPVDLERVDVGHIAKSCVALLAPMAQKKNILLHLELEDGVFVMARRDQLTQVFLNLLMNATTAIGSSGGRVNISIQMAQGQCRVMVEDSGPGIASSVREHLFEPFATGHKDGTGLGLYLSRNLIRSFNGELFYDDKVTDKTCFVISLPSAP